MLFGSSSRTTENVQNNNSDERQIADNGGNALNSGGGDLSFTVVADEAFQLAETALYSTQDALAMTSETFQTALQGTQRTSRSEGAQLTEILILVGVPALALAFILGAFRNG